MNSSRAIIQAQYTPHYLFTMYRHKLYASLLQSVVNYHSGALSITTSKGHEVYSQSIIEHRLEAMITTV